MVTSGWGIPIAVIVFWSWLNDGEYPKSNYDIRKQLSYYHRPLKYRKLEGIRKIENLVVTDLKKFFSLVHEWNLW